MRASATGAVLSGGSVNAGMRIVEGVLWLAGPEGTIWALAANLIGRISEDNEPRPDNAYNWAVEQVYKESLPPRENIIITDTIGAEDRPLVFPRSDGKIVMNLGKDLFDNLELWVDQAIAWAAGAPPANFGPPILDKLHTFIHELGHVWHLHNRPLETVWLGEAIIGK